MAGNLRHVSMALLVDNVLGVLELVLWTTSWLLIGVRVLFRGWGKSA